MERSSQPPPDHPQRQERGKVQYSARHRGLHSTQDPGPVSKAGPAHRAPPSTGQTPSAAPLHPCLLKPPHTFLLHQALATMTAGEWAWSNEAEGGAWITPGFPTAPPVLLQQSGEQSSQPPPDNPQRQERSKGPVLSDAPKPPLTSGSMPGLQGWPYTPRPAFNGQTPSAAPLHPCLIQPPHSLLYQSLLASGTCLFPLLRDPSPKQTTH